MSSPRIHPIDNAGALGLDLGKLCFSFSPGFLNASAALRSGNASYIELSLRSRACFVPVITYRSSFLRLMTLLAVPQYADGEELSSDDELAAVDMLISVAKDMRLAHRITQPRNWVIFSCYPQGSKAAPFGSYVLSLTPGIDTIWSNLHSKHRNAIRSSIRAGTQVRHGPDQLEAFHNIYSQTMQRNGLSFEPIGFFKELDASQDLSTFCGVAYRDGIPVGSAFLPFNKKSAFYLYGGSAQQSGAGGATNLLHYEAIRFMRNIGTCSYDFVGARVAGLIDERIAGIQRFKARFGGSLRNGWIWKLDISKTHCMAYDLIRSTKALALRSPKSNDIIDQVLRNASRDPMEGEAL